MNTPRKLFRLYPLAIALLALLLGFAPNTFAETSSNSSASSNADMSGGDDTQQVALPKAPEVTPGKMPTPPADRAKSSAKAKADALAGSQQSQAMCNMLRQKALEEMEKDKDDAMLLMALAQQSCQQADQSKKAAEENDKGQKMISQADVPEMAKMKLQDYDVQGAVPKAKEPDLSAFRALVDDNNTVRDGAVSDAPLGTDPSQISALLRNANAASQVLTADQMAKETKEGATKETQKADAPDRAPATESLAAIPDAKDANGNTNGNGPQNSSGANAPGGLPIAASAAAAAAAEKKTEGNATYAGTSDRGRRGSRQPDGAGAGGGGGGDGEKKQDPLEQMLAQLLGGGAPEEGASVLPSDGTGIVTGLGKAGAPQKAMNVFEYANLRYARLHEQGRLGKMGAVPAAGKSAPGHAPAAPAQPQAALDAPPARAPAQASPSSLAAAPAKGPLSAR